MKSILPFLLSLLSLPAFSQSAFINGNPLHVVDASNLTVTGTLFNFYTPEVESNSNGETVVATSFFNTYIIDAATMNVTDSLTGFRANFVPGNSATEMFGVNSGTFYSLDFSSMTLDSLALPGTDRVTRRPGTEEVWVTADSVVHIVDVSSGMSLQSTLTTGFTEYDGSELRFSGDGSIGIKMNWNSKTVVKIDAAAKTVEATLDMAFAANISGVEVTADGAHAFISSSNASKVYKIQVSDMSLVDSTSLPHPPFGMYRHPGNGDIWAVGHFDNVIYLLDPADLSLKDSVEVAGDPHIVAFLNDVVGLNELESKTSLNVYPNPVNDVLTVSDAIPGEAWAIIDVSGRIVSTGIFRTQNAQLSFSDLKSGTYMLSSAGKTSKVIRN